MLVESNSVVGQSTTAQNQGAINDGNFLREQQRFFLDLNRSDTEIMREMAEKLSDPDISPAQQQVMVAQFQRRESLKQILSNLTRAIFESIRNVVQNLRI